MPEPISAGAATLVLTGAAVPVLTIWGVSLGLRADVLLAGFLGAVAAIALLNTVPSTGDTWRELLRTTARRIAVALGSAAVAGYLAPGMTPAGVSVATLLGVSFIVGAGAQKALNMAVDKAIKGGDKP
jgi:NaMN:DMB phosphoribosyltransferase